MQYVKIKDKEYPVLYNIPALMWYADWQGIPLRDIKLEEQELTERKLCALLYSGLVAGSEEAGKRLDISFSGFQALLIDDEDQLSDRLGTQFRRQMEVTLAKYGDKSEVEEIMDKKKAPRRVKKTT